MSDRTDWIGTAAVASLAVICCAGPLLAVGLASLGAGAWLGAHGLWLLGGLVLLLISAALIIAYRRRRAMAACAVEERDGAGPDLTHVPSEPNKASGR